MTMLEEINETRLLLTEWRDARDAFFVGVVSNAPADERAATGNRLAEAEHAPPSTSQPDPL